MTLEHVAIWTDNLEQLKAYYTKYFGGTANNKYINPKKQFESYFLTFEPGARLELMARADIPENKNDTVTAQHKGIIHLAFGVETVHRKWMKKQNNCRLMVIQYLADHEEPVMGTMNLKHLTRIITGLK
jgi:lactoylglutathione lyase